MDGLICYMDATCHCEARRGGGSVGGHTLDMLELEAMMRTIPAKLSPPVLVLLARMDDPQVPVTDSDHDADGCVDHSGHRRCPQGEAPIGSPPPRHRPAMLYNVLSKLDLPWAVSGDGGGGDTINLARLIPLLLPYFPCCLLGHLLPLPSSLWR